MNTLAARNQFRNGLMALVDRNYAEAAEFFRAAMDAERNLSEAGRCKARSLSYHGLSLALADRPTRQAIEACEMAVRADPDDPDLHLNLGRVLALAGRKTRALAAFGAGLALNPDHRGLRAEAAKIDRRRRPVVPFLSRSNPLNYGLGRLKAALNRPVGTLRQTS